MFRCLTHSVYHNNFKSNPNKVGKQPNPMHQDHVNLSSQDLYSQVKLQSLGVQEKDKATPK